MLTSLNQISPASGNPLSESRLQGLGIIGILQRRAERAPARHREPEAELNRPGFVGGLNS